MGKLYVVLFVCIDTCVEHVPYASALCAGEMFSVDPQHFIVLTPPPPSLPLSTTDRILLCLLAGSGGNYTRRNASFQE